MGSSSSFPPDGDGNHPMTKTMLPVFICPKLMGRQVDITALHMLIDRKNSGQGQMILISGEAGIGKSRLVAEVKSYASQRDYLILEGQCFQTDSTLPYAPLVDLFRSYFAHYASTSLADNMYSFLSTLSRLLPELALLFPDLANFPEVPLEPEEEKRRLFAAMTLFLTEQAAQHPALLVVEDVHWCDDLSLDFLLHLTRRCRNIPLLFLITYRSDEQHPRLKQWLAYLDRERLALEFSLERLSHRDVADMLQDMLDSKRGIDDDLVDMIFTRSEGNPFFVEELLKSLITAKEVAPVNGTWKRTGRLIVVPRSVQEAVQQRTTYLSADAKRLLTLAAAFGRRFNVTLLQEAIDCDEAHMLILLKELMAAQLVIEEEADLFAFRHALTQQAILHSLLLREHQRLHRNLAECLERLCTSSPSFRERYLEDLANHCYEAGMWEQALAYSQEAGEKALSLYAQQAAIEHFTRVVEAAHHLSQTPHAYIYLKRGKAYETLGNFERALGDYERGLDAARTTHDSEMEWQSMEALGSLWSGHDYERAGVWFHLALSLAGKLPDSTLRAHSLNHLGNWLQNTGKIQEALETHHEALRLFEAQANRQGMAETLEMLGGIAFFTGDTARAVKVYFAKAIELFRALDDKQKLASTLAVHACDAAPETIEPTFSALRTRDECVQDAEEALLVARQTNSPSGLAFVEIATTFVLSSFGEFGPALSHAQEALNIATSIEHQEWIAASNAVLGHLYLLLLEPDEAASYLETGIAGAKALGSMIWIGLLTPYLALAYIHKRAFPRAESVLTTVLQRDQQPISFFERQAARAWCELALAQGEASRALAIAEHLIVSAPGDEQQPIPHLLALKGRALLSLKRLVEAAEALEQAKLGAKQRQAPSILWHIHCSLGQVFHLLKQEVEAQHEWSKAREIINRLTETIDETSLKEHFLQTAMSFLPQVKQLSQKVMKSNLYGGLSTREREVAALVAQGRSNREIADSLVVSERTAEAHVSNILGKLGFSTRAQIAAWAVEIGLTTTH